MCYAPKSACRYTPKSQGCSDLHTLFFATDLHGSTRAFRKFLAAQTFYRVEALILGGDLSGKRTHVYRQRANGSYEIGTTMVESRAALREFGQALENRGEYLARCDEEAPSRELLEALHTDCVLARLGEWAQLARDQDLPEPIVTITGNDDEPSVRDELTGSDSFALADGTLVTNSHGWAVLGVPYSTPTPWNTPQEMNDPQLAKYLANLPAWPEDRVSILNCHVPPLGSGLDLAPKLDSELRPVISGGGVVREPVGSDSVGAFVAATQPLLGLFGHVHESRAVTRIGRTLCVNPGSRASEGVLQGVVCSFSRRGGVSWQLTEG